MSKTTFSVVAGVCAMLAGGLPSVRAQAQQPVRLDIVSQPLSDALRELATVSNTNIVFEPGMVNGITAPALKGSITPEEALLRLLSGTKWSFKFVDENTVSLIPRAETAITSTSALLDPQDFGRDRPSIHEEMKFAQNFSADGTAVGDEKAQASGRKDDAQTDRLEEIIVTAQKREQSVHDVPMAIEVRTGEFIEQTGFVDFEDYARTISNIGFTPSGARNGIKISLRGISPLLGAPTVGFYLDDTVISGLGTLGNLSAGAVDPRLYDIARVEVLKGPQGHLYGASAMGGVIKIVTNQPQFNEWGGRMDATLSDTHYGGLNELLNLAMNVPLLQDRAALRLVFSLGQDSGYIDQVSPFLGTSTGNEYGLGAKLIKKEDVNSVDTLAARGVLLLQPADWLSVTPMVYYQKKGYGGQQGLTPANGSIDGSPQALLYQDEDVESALQIYSLTAEADVGLGSVKSITSYADFNGKYGRDITNFVPFLTGAPVTLEDTFYFPPYKYFVHNEQFIQELRFVSEWDFPLGLTAGAYYRNNDTDHQSRLVPPGAGAHFPILTTLGYGDSLVQTNAAGETTEKALFGNLTYVFHGLELQFGARYFVLDIDSGAQLDGIFNAATDPSVFVSQPHFNESGVNVSASIAYDLTDNHRVYARAAEGFREGSRANPSAAAVLCPQTGVDGNVDSDSVWNYELGAKTRWANGRLTVDAALFLIDYTDVQQGIRLSCGPQITDNAGAATSKGFELQLSAEPVDGFVITGSVGHVDATLDTSVPNIGGDRGESLLYIPNWTANSSLAYTRGTSIPALDMTFRADWSYVDKQAVNFGGVGTGPTGYTDPYGLLSLRIGVSHDRGWQASVFVDNVLDKRANVGPSDFGMPLVFINQPRTIGVNFKKAL